MENFDHLTTLPGTAQEQAWLKERLETLSVREGYALTAALTQSPPESMGGAIDLCCSLDDYEICNAGSYEQLGRLCLIGYRLPKEVLPHVDLCRLGEKYEEEHPGLFVGDSFVVYPCENHILHRKPGAPLPEDNDWSVKLKLASPSCPEGVWIRLPDLGPTEEPLALKELGVGKVGDCTLLEARCILPEAGNLLEQYDNAEELMTDGENLGCILAEQGQGMPHYMERLAAALEYEDCRTLRFLLDISQNLQCYEWLPSGDLDAFAEKHLRSCGVPEELIQSDCIDLKSYAGDLLDQASYVLTRDESAYVARNSREFTYEFSDPPQPGMVLE